MADTGTGINTERADLENCFVDFVAPAESRFIFLLMVWLYYSLGTTLERTWGTFRYNVYIISGMLFTVIRAFVLYGVLCATYDAAFIGGQTLLLTGSGLFSVSYIYMSIFWHSR